MKRWRSGKTRRSKINGHYQEEIKDRPFSLFIPECELDEFFYDESIGFKLDDDHLRDEPISPIGMRLRLERERNVNKVIDN